MDTNRLKKFAAEARNILIQGVKQRLVALGFAADGKATEEPQQHEGGATFMGNVVSNDFYTQWMSLQRAIGQRGIKEVAEEAAYTWFNRLVAIRILVKNGLIAPVLAYESEDVHIPVLVSEARQGRLPQMDEQSLRQWEELMNDDSKTDRQFALLIVAFCHATPILHQCFGRITDYTELLLPTNILSEGGLVDLLNHTPFISEEDYRSPELIGWLYQFYISEKKDEVFAKKGKFEADEIPAATQIFTPNWIVKYMVQNTVGRIYLDNNPYSELKETMAYLVEPEEPAPEASIFRFDDIHELTCADLACGSGHILNECFDLLYQCYMEEGYSRRQAVEDIFRYNLTGIDLDTRAKQLATFSLLLKACQKDSSFVDAHCLPRVMDMPVVDRYTFKDLDGHFCCAYGLEEPGNHAYKELEEAFALMEQADSLGSIMKFEISDDTRAFIRKCIDAYEAEPKYANNFRPLMDGYRMILTLSEKYAALVMNPPYMYSSNMPKELSTYINGNYDEGRTDLCVAFMRVAQRLLKDYGKYGMINMQSWMFLTSFNKLRNDILTQTHIDSLLHLGPHTFDELNGEVVQSVAFVISLKQSKSMSLCCRLISGNSSSEKERMFLSNIDKLISFNQNEFTDIPGEPLAYWVTSSIMNAFRTNKLMNELAYARVGMFTGDNSRFLKQWWEIDNIKMECHISDNQCAIDSNKKWFAYNKGGGYRKWYGNLDLVVNYYNNGFEIFNLAKIEKRNCQNYPTEYKFREGITWTGMSADNISFRYVPHGALFDSNKGPMIFSVENGPDLPYIIAFLNTKVCNRISTVLNPTLSKQVNDILNFPLIIDNRNKNFIQEIGNKCVTISRQDWDSHETSWDFENNPLLVVDENTYIDNIHHQQEEYEKETGEYLCIAPAAPELDSLEWRMKQYKQKWEHLFRQLHENEEELNRQFIDIYGLQDELTPDVPLEEVTILQQGEISIQS